MKKDFLISHTIGASANGDSEIFGTSEEDSAEFDHSEDAENGITEFCCPIQ